MNKLNQLLNRSIENKTKKAYYKDNNSDTKIRIEYSNPAHYVFLNNECVGMIETDQNKIVFNSFKHDEQFVISEIMHIERVHFDGNITTNAL